MFAIYIPSLLRIVFEYCHAAEWRKLIQIKEFAEFGKIQALWERELERMFLSVLERFLDWTCPTGRKYELVKQLLQLDYRRSVSIPDVERFRFDHGILFEWRDMTTQQTVLSLLRKKKVSTTRHWWTMCGRCLWLKHRDFGTCVCGKRKPHCFFFSLAFCRRR
jgi:hypothetical protein